MTSKIVKGMKEAVAYAKGEPINAREIFIYISFEEFLEKQGAFVNLKKIETREHLIERISILYEQYYFEIHLQDLATLDFETLKQLYYDCLILAEEYDNNPFIKPEHFISHPDNWGKPIPIQEAIKNDPALREVIEQIERGELQVNAPFPGMHEPWTQEAKDKVKQILSKRYGNKPIIADAPFPGIDEPWTDAEIKALDDALDEALAPTDNDNDVGC